MLILAAGQTPAYLPQVAALVIGGAVVAYFGFRAGLVPIVAFLLTGVAIGPNALGLVSDLDVVDAVAEVGVLLLLFTIGMEFSLDRLKDLRRPLFLGGGLQVGLTTLITFGVLIAAGVDTNAALFTGLLVSLSSTAIVLKLLADRGEMGTEAGRITVAVLLFQDLAIVAMVLLVPVLGETGGSAGGILVALGTAAAIIALVVVLARRVLPPALEVVARTCSPEIFLLTIIAVCVGTAYATSLAGVSVSLGAFLAGLVVSESRFSSQALGEILPLQIVFSAVFFISIGMLLDLGFLIGDLPMVLGAVAALFLVKALAATAAVLTLTRRLAVAAAAGLTLAQVGEFSFVLAAAGLAEGLTPAGLGDDGTQAFFAATVLLMAATPALAELGERLQTKMTPAEGAPSLPGRDVPLPGATVAEGIDDHVIIAGYGHWGRGISRVLADADVPQVIATLSPEGAMEAHDEGMPVLLGDPGRLRTLTEAGVARARAVVIADDATERAAHLVRVVRTVRPDVLVVVRTRYAADAAALEAEGADHVVTEEIEASVMLIARLLKLYGAAFDEAMHRSHGVRAFYDEDDGPAPAASRPGQHTVVDTQAEIDVEGLDPDACPHTDQVRPVVPQTAGCEECLRNGDRWVHLRLCLTCGHVGCCDSSPNRHARAHHTGTGHHVMRSVEPGESWVYCLEDERELARRTSDARPTSPP